MCEKCEFFDKMVEQAQEIDFTPDEFMHGLTSLILQGVSGASDKHRKDVVMAVYTKDGELLQISGAAPYLTPEAQYKLDQEMQDHNAKRTNPEVVSLH